MTVPPRARPSGDPSLLRRLNLAAVLRVLFEGDVYSITDLARAAGLSRPTTTQAVEDLLAAGWITPVTEDGQDRGLGRPAQKFELRADAGYVLGADVGAHKVLVLIGDLRGRVVARARCAVEPGDTPQARLEAVSAMIEAALAGMPEARARITDAGVATVGSVEPDGRVIYCKAMNGWEGQNPALWIAERFGFPSRGFNDMAMAALAEHWQGAARDVHDVVYLHAGRRLGAALLLGGKPHRGFHSAATQIGMWRELSWRSDYSALLQPSGHAGELFVAAAAGDAAAHDRIEEFADEVCQGIAPIIITVDPEMLVIGGGISAAGEAIAAPLRKRIDRETSFPPKVVCSTLGDEAVALGALRSALDRAEERLFASLSA